MTDKVKSIGLMTAILCTGIIIGILIPYSPFLKVQRPRVTKNKYRSRTELMLNKLLEDVRLDDKQQEKIKPILQKYQGQFYRLNKVHSEDILSMVKAMEMELQEHLKEDQEERMAKNVAILTKIFQGRFKQEHKKPR